MITDQKVNNKIVGVYVIGNDVETSVKIATTVKPNLFRRLFTWVFLGWKWITIEKMKEKKGN